MMRATMPWLLAATLVLAQPAQAQNDAGVLAEARAWRSITSMQAGDWNAVARSIDSSEMRWFAGEWLNLGNTGFRSVLVAQGYNLPPAGSLALHDPALLVADALKARAKALPGAYAVDPKATYTVVASAALADTAAMITFRPIEASTGATIGNDVKLAVVRRGSGWYLRLPLDLTSFLAGIQAGMQMRQ